MQLNPFGHFEGEVGNDWPGDHPRIIRLTRTIYYFDPDGVEWDADRGEVVNGASTGWFFRRLFPAFVGFYRRATVFHDVACKSKRRPSKQVHLMFWNGMRCDILNMARWEWKFRGRTIVAPDRLWSFVCWERACQAWVIGMAVNWFGPRFKGASPQVLRIS